MLGWLRQRRGLRRRARFLYGSIVTQARSPDIYAGWHVPDTPEGRFEAIALHLVLAMRRLAGEGEAGQALGRVLTEAFVVDLDDMLREMTVGDLAVPRHVKRAVAVLHDRYAAYGAALSGGPPGSLQAAVEARIGTLKGAGGLDAQQICAYIEEAARTLELQPGAQVLDGHLAWPAIHARRSDEHSG